MLAVLLPALFLLAMTHARPRTRRSRAAARARMVAEIARWREPAARRTAEVRRRGDAARRSPAPPLRSFPQEALPTKSAAPSAKARRSRSLTRRAMNRSARSEAGDTSWNGTGSVTRRGARRIVGRSHDRDRRALGKRAMQLLGELGYGTWGCVSATATAAGRCRAFRRHHRHAAPALSRNRSSIPEKVLRILAWTDAAAEWRHRSGHGCSLRALSGATLAQAPGGMILGLLIGGLVGAALENQAISPTSPHHDLEI